MSINRNLFIIPFFILLASCASFHKDNSAIEMETIHSFTTGPLVGIVYGTNNKPCPDVSITLLIEKTSEETVSGESENKEQEQFDTVKSDINGRFLIPDVPKGDHVIQIEKKGYESGRIEFSFNDTTQVFYIQIASLQSLQDEIEEALDKRELERLDETIDRALKIDPKSIETLYLKAVYHSLMKDDDNARKTLELIKGIDD